MQNQIQNVSFADQVVLDNPNKIAWGPNNFIAVATENIVTIYHLCESKLEVFNKITKHKAKITAISWNFPSVEFYKPNSFEILLAVGDEDGNCLIYDLFTLSRLGGISPNSSSSFSIFDIKWKIDDPSTFFILTAQPSLISVSVGTFETLDRSKMEMISINSELFHSININLLWIQDIEPGYKFISLDLYDTNCILISSPQSFNFFAMKIFSKNKQNRFNNSVSDILKFPIDENQKLLHIEYFPFKPNCLILLTDQNLYLFNLFTKVISTIVTYNNIKPFCYCNGIFSHSISDRFWVATTDGSIYRYSISDDAENDDNTISDSWTVDCMISSPKPQNLLGIFSDFLNPSQLCAIYKDGIAIVKELPKSGKIRDQISQNQNPKSCQNKTTNANINTNSSSNQIQNSNSNQNINIKSNYNKSTNSVENQNMSPEQNKNSNTNTNTSTNAIQNDNSSSDNIIRSDKIRRSSMLQIQSKSIQAMLNRSYSQGSSFIERENFYQILNLASDIDRPQEPPAELDVARVVGRKCRLFVTSFVPSLTGQLVSWAAGGGRLALLSSAGVVTVLAPPEEEGDAQERGRNKQKKQQLDQNQQQMNQKQLQQSQINQLNKQQLSQNKQQNQLNDSQLNKQKLNQNQQQQSQISDSQMNKQHLDQQKQLNQNKQSQAGTGQPAKQQPRLSASHVFCYSAIERICTRFRVPDPQATQVGLYGCGSVVLNGASLRVVDCRARGRVSEIPKRVAKFVIKDDVVAFTPTLSSLELYTIGRSSFVKDFASSVRLFCPCCDDKSKWAIVLSSPSNAVFVIGYVMPKRYEIDEAVFGSIVSIAFVGETVFLATSKSIVHACNLQTGEKRSVVFSAVSMRSISAYKRYLIACDMSGKCAVLAARDLSFVSTASCFAKDVQVLNDELCVVQTKSSGCPVLMLHKFPSLEAVRAVANSAILSEMSASNENSNSSQNNDNNNNNVNNKKDINNNNDNNSNFDSKKDINNSNDNNENNKNNDNNIIINSNNNDSIKNNDNNNIISNNDNDNDNDNDNNKNSIDSSKNGNNSDNNDDDDDDNGSNENNINNCKNSNNKKGNSDGTKNSSTAFNNSNSTSINNDNCRSSGRPNWFKRAFWSCNSIDDFEKVARQIGDLMFLQFVQVAKHEDDTVLPSVHCTTRCKFVLNEKCFSACNLSNATFTDEYIEYLILTDQYERAAKFALSTVNKQNILLAHACLSPANDEAVKKIMKLIPSIKGSERIFSLLLKIADDSKEAANVASKIVEPLASIKFLKLICDDNEIKKFVKSSKIYRDNYFAMAFADDVQNAFTILLNSREISKAYAYLKLIEEKMKKNEKSGEVENFFISNLKVQLNDDWNRINLK